MSVRDEGQYPLWWRQPKTWENQENETVNVCLIWGADPLSSSHGPHCPHSLRASVVVRGTGWPAITGIQILFMASLYFLLLKSLQKIWATFSTFIDTILFPDCMKMIIFKLDIIHIYGNDDVMFLWWYFCNLRPCIDIGMVQIDFLYPKCVVLYFVQAVFVRSHSDTLIHAYPSIFWRR